MDSLFGDNFDIEIKKTKTKSLIQKLKSEELSAEDAAKIAKSKTVSFEDKLKVIQDRIYAVLGKQINDTLTIRSYDRFKQYIDTAIRSKVIAIDTETHNSTDVWTTDIAGLCLYTPGEKQAYIPITHVDHNTGKLLPNQVTKEQVKEQLQRLIDNHVFVIMHNGKFDYNVIRHTCGIEIKPDWDTMIAAFMIDENEEKSLKKQYILHIDPSQEKYDIDSLFNGIPYIKTPPELFALYAAHDSLMTYDLYKYQEPILNLPENKKVKWVFENIEMPIVIIDADMEKTGIAVNLKMADRLKMKYDQVLKNIDKTIADDLKELQPQIDKWKLTPEANAKTRTYVSAKSVMSKDKIEAMYPNIDEEGKRYKISKAKVDQLSDPINLASPMQVAILFYDILGIESVSRKSPRGTGADELEAIAEKYPKLKICQALNERKKTVKVISTYIDTIPAVAEHYFDKRMRTSFLQCGAATGRFSSGGEIKAFDDKTDTKYSLGGVNIMGIPSHNTEIRLLFTGGFTKGEVEPKNNIITLPEITEIETTEGYKFGKDIKTGDGLVTDEGNKVIKNIKYSNKTYYIAI